MSNWDAEVIRELRDEINDLQDENQRLFEELQTYRRDTGHVVELREDSWTLQHPLSCRPNLFDCMYNFAAATFAEASEHAPGRYRVKAEGGKLFLGERL